MMAAVKGTRPPAAGLGRKPGVPNKTTGVAREMFSLFIEANADKIQDLFDRVAADDPARALELIAKIAEYVVPKLARTEVLDTTPGHDLAARAQVRAAEILSSLFEDGGPGMMGPEARRDEPNRDWEHDA